jgi:hypothetical protein
MVGGFSGFGTLTDISGEVSAQKASDSLRSGRKLVIAIVQGRSHNCSFRKLGPRQRSVSSIPICQTRSQIPLEANRPIVAIHSWLEFAADHFGYSTTSGSSTATYVTFSTPVAAIRLTMNALSSGPGSDDRHVPGSIGRPRSLGAATRTRAQKLERLASRRTRPDRRSCSSDADGRGEPSARLEI